MVITEHSMKENKLLHTKLTHYKLIRGFYKNFTKKGGVAIYAHEKLGNQILSKEAMVSSKELTCEQYAFTVELKKKPYISLASTDPQMETLKKL